MTGGKNYGEISVYPIDEEQYYWAFLYDDCFKGDIVEITYKGADNKLEAIIEDYYKDEWHMYVVYFFNEMKERRAVYPYYDLKKLYINSSQYKWYKLENPVKNDLKIGDVVLIHSDDEDNLQTAVVESYDFEPDKYVVNFFYEEAERTAVYELSALEFMYHDSAQCSMFMEKLKSSLPLWDEDIYDYYEEIDEYIWRNPHHRCYDCYCYYNNLLYIEEMNIILNEYSLIYRYSKICHDYREKLISEFGWSNNEFNETYEQLSELFQKIDKEYSHKDHGFDPKKRYDRLLTDKTRLLLNAVDKLDKERWENKTKDHFPYYMSNYAVLQAIKEAYMAADIIGVYKNNLMLCEGNTKGGLKIRIYFDMKEKRIITAYPVRI